jgi:hypothetical protein
LNAVIVEIKFYVTGFVQNADFIAIMKYLSQRIWLRFKNFRR